jgi:uncharacterized protein YndB with AHSA1/START domain
VLTHERFPSEEAARRHEQGWSQIAGKLGDYLVGQRRTSSDDFRLTYEFAAPAENVYRQFATQAGIGNWWTAYCQMEERVGGRAAFRFPSSDFYAIVEIARLDPGRAVEWVVIDSQHPAESGFVDLHDWVGTRISFEMEPVAPDRTVLHLTHFGLQPKECFGVCSSAWAFFVNQSLRGYLETGAGQPHSKDRPQDRSQTPASA